MKADLGSAKALVGVLEARAPIRLLREPFRVNGSQSGDSRLVMNRDDAFSGVKAVSMLRVGWEVTRSPMAGNALKRCPWLLHA